ncbi:MAG TPA: helix-turn-helix transcriptional regulator [Geothrix sp.]|nr:helix-turn-helix transcriptional regulator [Geothrix sp.]
MPNIASVMKEEILRLARKEVRSETEGLKKASAQYRSDIAALKRRIVSLEKQLSHVEKKGAAKAAAPAEGEAGPRIRFSAKGLATQRQRFGFSAAEMGALVGVSAQTIYNWEAGKSRPRAQQLAALGALRSMGKRQAKAQLAALQPQEAKD